MARARKLIFGGRHANNSDMSREHSNKEISQIQKPSFHYGDHSGAKKDHIGPENAYY